MAKRRRRRKKNLSTGAWVAIAVGLGVVVPAAIVGGIVIYGIKKTTKMAEDFHDNIPTATTEPNRPIPPIPPV